MRGLSSEASFAQDRDGTAYYLDPGTDAYGRATWSLVISDGNGQPARLVSSFEPCLQPMSDGLVAGPENGAFLLLYDSAARDDYRPGSARLVVAGAAGIRTQRTIGTDSFGSWVRGLIRSPRGDVYLFTQDFNPGNGNLRSTALELLGPYGRAKAGWPFTATEQVSWPRFGPDGTVYLAQASGESGRLIALSRDGRVKPGWPSVLPGVFAAHGGGDPTDVREPSLAPDGSLYDTFHDGVYRVGPDGQALPGWPYLLPSGTTLGEVSQAAEGTEAFDATLADDGRIYTARHDARYAPTHDDVVCLGSDGGLCPGWPVKLPDTWSADGLSLDGAWVNVAILRLDPSSGSAVFRSVMINGDGALFHLVEPGESLWGIAADYGLAVDALMAANPDITDTSLIPAGQLLAFPQSGGGQ